MNAPLESVEGVSRETAERLTALREVAEVLVFHLAELPAKVTLVFDVAVGHPKELRACYLTTSREHAADLSRIGEIVLTPTEYEALTLALSDGCCTRANALQELGRKLSNARHRITLGGLADGVANVDRAGERWTVGELARALGAELVDLRWESAAPAAQEEGTDGSA
jgi:hypothetical protein